MKHNGMDRRLRPALIVGNFLSGFIETTCPCEELSGRLAAEGRPVLTTSHHLSRSARLLDMLWTAWSARRRYEVAQVDVYAWRSFLWAEAVCAILQRAGKPYALTLHSGGFPEFARGAAGRVRRLLASAAAVTAPSGYLVEQMHPYRGDIRMIPNAIELEHYPFQPRRKAKPALVWLRAFHAMYNAEMAPKVVALLRPEFPDIRLIMVGRDKGDGSLERTKRVSEALGVEASIEFPGGVPKADVPRWLNRGSVFLNTTNVDNMPVSVVEAMACGLCTVSTKVGGIPYLLEDGKDALLTPPDDAAAMATAVKRILTDDALAERLSVAGRLKAERHGWGVVLPRWDELLDHLEQPCAGRARSALTPATKLMGKGCR